MNLDLFLIARASHSPKKNPFISNTSSPLLKSPTLLTQYTSFIVFNICISALHINMLISHTCNSFFGRQVSIVNILVLFNSSFYLEEHDLQQIQYQLHEKQQKYANLVMKKELRTSTLKPHSNPQQQHSRPDPWLAQVSDKRNMLSSQLASLFRLKLTPHPTIHGISVSFLHPIPRIFPFLSLFQSTLFFIVTKIEEMTRWKRKNHGKEATGKH